MVKPPRKGNTVDPLVDRSTPVVVARAVRSTSGHHLEPLRLFNYKIRVVMSPLGEFRNLTRSPVRAHRRHRRSHAGFLPVSPCATMTTDSLCGLCELCENRFSWLLTSDYNH